MRYLIVCDYSLTFVGGAQSALLRQAAALVSQGDSVAVLAPSVAQAKLPAEVLQIEPPNFRVAPVLQLPLFRNNRSLRRFCASIIERFKPDALITHSEFGLAAAATTVARSQRVLSMHVVHTFMWNTPAGSAPLAPIANGLHRFATGLVAPRQKLARNPMDSALRNMTLATALHADVAISPSKHQAEKLGRAGVTGVEVLSNVTEASSQSCSLPTGPTLRLAWVGRFSVEKRLEVAIAGVEQAQRRLAEEGLDPNLIELHIAGGHERTDDNHFWHGILKPDAVAELIRSCHALVLTSLGFDNQPMVALEAFSHGRPVIVTDPVLGEEFGEAAILTETPDAHGLASTLVELIKTNIPLEAAVSAARNYSASTSAVAHSQRLRELVEFRTGLRKDVL